MKTLGILKKVRELLTEESKWIKEQYSEETSKGMKYCLMGAIYKTMDTYADGDITEKIRKELVSTIKEIYSDQMKTDQFGDGSVEDFNDHDQTTHPMILTTLDSTIERLRKPRPDVHL